MTERVTRAPRRLLILSLGVFGALGAPAIAWAEDPPASPPADAAAAPAAPPAPAPTADSLLKDGNALMKSGNLVDACKAFEASIAIDKRATTVVRLGECREANHQLASAVAAYKDALAVPKVDKKSKKTATAKVAELSPKVSTLRLTVPDASAIEGLALTRGGEPIAADMWNTAIPMDGGDYVIEATAPKYLPWKETATVPAESGDITVKVPPLEAEPPPPPPPPPEPPKVEPAKVEPPKVEPAPVQEQDAPNKWTTITPMRKIALGVAGAGVVSFTVAIVLGVQADNKYDESRDLCPDLEFPCVNATEATVVNDSARSRALGSNIMYTVGAAAVIGAGVMWFLGAPSAEESGGVAIAPSITPTDASVSLIGRF